MFIVTSLGIGDFLTILEKYEKYEIGKSSDA
jgi:hypothetical protein